MKKILITGNTFDIAYRQKLEELGYVIENPQGILSERELIQQIKDAEIYFFGGEEKVTPRVVSSAGKLKAITFFGDQPQTFFTENAFELTTQFGIPIFTTPKASTNAVAEMTIGLILSLARAIPYQHNIVRRGEWVAYQSQEITDKILGVIGLGEICQTVAKKAKGLEMDVSYWSRTRKKDVESELDIRYSDFKDVLSASDFITLHLEYNPHTRHIIGNKEFSLMKRNPYLINAARPWLVDPEALYNALVSEKIRGTAFDGWYTENISQEDERKRKFIEKLRELDERQLIITAHQAYNTPETNSKVSQMAVDSVIALTTGNIYPDIANSQYQNRFLKK